MNDKMKLTIDCSDETKPKYIIEFNVLDENGFIAICKTLGNVFGFPQHVINSHIFTDEELCDYVMEVESDLQRTKDCEDEDDSF